VSADARPSPATYLGLFFVALATLMYEILLTRIFSVTMMYHFAFVALSLAMFGMTVGALIVYLAPQVFRPEQLSSRLRTTAVLLPIAMVLSFLTQLSIPFRFHPSVVAIYAVVLTYCVIAVPFVVSGIVVCLTLTGYPSRISRLYAADLIGAALGCVLLIPILDYSDGPTAVLWVAVFAGLGAIAYTWNASGSGRAAALATTVLIVIAAAGNTALAWRQFSVLRILYVKGSFEARPLYDKWNSYSRVRVNGNEAEEVAPQGWGLSSTLPADLRVRQLQMDIDIIAGTVMTEYHGDPAAIRHLRYDVTNFAYFVRPEPKALVIGAGGGRDILSALAFGAPSVVAVEINKSIIDTVNGRFGDFTGHLDRNPRVRFVNDEARSYIARSADRYDLIQISLIDTWAATAAGAFVLSENAVYTAEAWSTFIRHLSPAGMLSVSRWYSNGSPAEIYRTFALAVEALRRAGIQDPSAHLALVRNTNPANRPETPDGVGTLLISQRPFTPEELATIERVANELRFEVMFTPRASRDDAFTRLTSSDAAAFMASYELNITPPTDNSPFFFNMLRLSDLIRPGRITASKQTNNLIAVSTLGILLVTVLGLTALCIVAPLWRWSRERPPPGSGPLLVFFIAIGLGFMLVETSQMQRLIIALGHPTYALSVVLFGLLLSSGIGSYLTRGLRPGAPGKAGAARLVALVVVLGIFGAATPALVHYTADGSTALRIGAALAVLFPPGLLMGMAFPIGMTLAADRAPALTPWLWGLNGAASVLASVLAICIALTWSISTAFWTGWLAYIVALAAFFQAHTSMTRSIE
jgi:predicted membrane-bound spermidine synthase